MGTVSLHLPARAQRALRRGERHATPAVAEATAPAACAATVAAKRGGVSHDQALYGCGCGMVFTAAVTASVGCPRCGTGQAW